jgi:hypothetical protein
MDAAVAMGIQTASSEDDLSKSSLAIGVHGVHTPPVGIFFNNPDIVRGAAHYQNFSTRIVQSSQGPASALPHRETKGVRVTIRRRTRVQRENTALKLGAISLRQQAVDHQRILGAYVHLAIGDHRHLKVEWRS